jgi:hypothetical protein
MKTVSIKQLHEKTGMCVREAGVEPLVITDRGLRVAVMKPYEATEHATPFPRRKAEDLPAITGDSTNMISADRDGR